MIVITKYKTLDYIFFYTFNLFLTLKFTGAFYCISFLTLPIVFSKISLSFTFYTSSFFILFILLWSSLKYFFLLRSLVWLLLPRLLVLLPLKSLILQLPQLLLLVFLCTAKVYQLYSAILQFLYLLWYFIYRYCLFITLIGSLLLEDLIINLNYLINKAFYILSIFYKY